MLAKNTPYFKLQMPKTKTNILSRSMTMAI